MITKEMLKRCQNELKQAFCALDKDVQDAMKANADFMERLASTGSWNHSQTPAWCANTVYRLSPDTPTEPEYVERDVDTDAFDFYFVCCGKCRYPTVLASATSHKDFLSIVYKDASGNERLMCTMSPQFGTPVRVRFVK